MSMAQQVQPKSKANGKKISHFKTDNFYLFEVSHNRRNSLGKKEEGEKR
jgi:hypothetical protein